MPCRDERDWEQEAEAVFHPFQPYDIALAWMSWGRWDVQFSFLGGLVSSEMHFQLKMCLHPEVEE